MKKFKSAFGGKSNNDGGGKQSDGSGAGPQQLEPETKSGVSGQKLRALTGQISTSIPLPPQVAGISSLLGTSSSRAANPVRTTSTASLPPPTSRGSVARPPVPSVAGLSRSLLSATQQVQRKVATPGLTRGYNESPRTTSAQQTQQGGGQNVNGSQAVPIPGGQIVNEAAAAFLALRLTDRSAVSSGTITQAVSVEETAEEPAVFCRWCDRCKEGMFCFRILN
jgi:hypothetical protein